MLVLLLHISKSAFAALCSPHLVQNFLIISFDPSWFVVLILIVSLSSPHLTHQHLEFEFEFVVAVMCASPLHCVTLVFLSWYFSWPISPT